MSGLYACVQRRVFQLDEVADPDTACKITATPHPGEGADLDVIRQRRVLDVRERLDLAVIADGHAGAEKHVRMHQNILPSFVSMLKKTVSGAVSVGAFQHRGAPHPALEDRFSLSQLNPVVDAKRFGLVAQDGTARQAVLAGQPDHIGEVILALGVVIPDAVQQASIDLQSPAIRPELQM